MLRDAMESAVLRAELPTIARIDRSTGSTVVAWSNPPTAGQQTRADAIIARFAGLPPVLSDAQVKTIRDRITQEEWQRKLDGDADMRVLFVVARRLYGMMRQLHPALPPFADFVAAVKADLDAEPVP